MQATQPLYALDADTVGDLFGEIRALREGVEAALSPDGRTAEAHNPDPHVWVSNQQLIEELRVSKPTLQRWRQSGELVFSKIGGIVFYRRSDVNAFLERHLQETSASAT